MQLTGIPVWKQAPFLRLILPLMTGIAFQYYLPLPAPFYWISITTIITLIILLGYLRPFTLFRYYRITGLSLNLLLACSGGIITCYHDLRKEPGWFGHHSNGDIIFIARINEPLVEKNKTFKANAAIHQIVFRHSLKQTKGNIILYFKKDSSVQHLSYNSYIAFKKRPELIHYTGNPGAFDYQRYCAFQGIYHQLYLSSSDYRIIPPTENRALENILGRLRGQIIHILRTYIPGEQESGLAEALLIGYKNDLDKELVQWYTNTGVVHVIAISGLHVGLIYWILNLVFAPVGRRKPAKMLRASLIIISLWLFGFLAGGSPSVLRSALMFTFMVGGENTGRKGSIYNSLSASAFLLLCFNPYWLWDAGFQLSYLAVLSIVMFMKPLYHLIFVENKLLDLVWKTAVICLAAQILTVPVSIFYFHQFPNYFLITNLVAVPLSSLVVLAELALVTFACFPLCAKAIGLVTGMLIRMLNQFIAHIHALPWATTDHLQLSFLQLTGWYIFIILTATWLTYKKPLFLLYSLCCLCGILMLRSSSVATAFKQNKLIVYNIPNRPAIGLLQGRHHLLITDDPFMQYDSAVNDYLRPTLDFYQVQTTNVCAQPSKPFGFLYGHKKIIIINSRAGFEYATFNDYADMVILSGNPHIVIPRLLPSMQNTLIIFDASNNLATIKRWKADCDKHNIKYYAVSEKGAFILNLN